MATLLTTPPHLKYAATLPRNLPSMACFADVIVSQGSVATYARCGGIINMYLIANLPGNLPACLFAARSCQCAQQQTRRNKHLFSTFSFFFVFSCRFRAVD